MDHVQWGMIPEHRRMNHVHEHGTMGIWECVLSVPCAPWGVGIEAPQRGLLTVVVILDPDPTLYGFTETMSN